MSVLFKDNGKGFQGDLSSLGEAFHRHTVTSGSGLGLNIVKSLVVQMCGVEPKYSNMEDGFAVELQVPKGTS